MSKEEAERIIRSWAEFKMMWFKSDGLYTDIEIDNARSVLGEDEYQKIVREITNLWNEE